MRLFPLVAVSVICGGCPPALPGDDGGVDAGLDAGADAGSDAGTTLIMLASGQRYLGPGFVADGTWVSWTADVGGQTQIVRVPASGGTPASRVPTLDGIHSLALDGTTLWWSAPQRLLTHPADGGAGASVAITDPVARLAAMGGEVFWTSGSGKVLRWRATDGVVPIAASQDDPQEVVLDPTSVYWQEFGVVGGIARLHRASRDGGSDVVLWTGRDGEQHLAVHGAWLYFTGAPQGSTSPPRLWRVPVGQGAAEQLADHLVLALAVDPTDVFWAEGGPDVRIIRSDHDGGSVATLATILDGGTPVAIALDATAVYWATSTSVWKLSR